MLILHREVFQVSEWHLSSPGPAVADAEAVQTGDHEDAQGHGDDDDIQYSEFLTAENTWEQQQHKQHWTMIKKCCDAKVSWLPNADAFIFPSGVSLSAVLFRWRFSADIGVPSGWAPLTAPLSFQNYRLLHKSGLPGFGGNLGHVTQTAWLLLGRHSFLSALFLLVCCSSCLLLIMLCRFLGVHRGERDLWSFILVVMGFEWWPKSSKSACFWLSNTKSAVL